MRLTDCCALVLCVLLLGAATGCGRETAAAGDAAPTASPTNDTLDLTQMSSTLSYAEVNRMLSSPDEYDGKTVTLRGPLSSYASTEADAGSVFAVVFSDATGCCLIGMEFTLAGGSTDPADYPAPGAEVCVTGTFEAYEADGFPYGHLVDATVSE